MARGFDGIDRPFQYVVSATGAVPFLFVFDDPAAHDEVRGALAAADVRVIVPPGSQAREELIQRFECWYWEFTRGCAERLPAMDLARRYASWRTAAHTPEVDHEG